MITLNLGELSLKDVINISSQCFPNYKSRICPVLPTMLVDSEARIDPEDLKNTLDDWGLPKELCKVR